MARVHFCWGKGCQAGCRARHMQAWLAASSVAVSPRTGLLTDWVSGWAQMWQAIVSVVDPLAKQGSTEVTVKPSAGSHMYYKLPGCLTGAHVGAVTWLVVWWCPCCGSLLITQRN